MVQIASNGLANVCASHAPIEMDGYTDESALHYDPEKAKLYMAESGVDASGIKLEIMALLMITHDLSNEPTLRKIRPGHFVACHIAH